MTWRELIAQYLAASANDDRNRLEAELGGGRREFVATHGTTRFKEFESDCLQSRAKNTEALSPSSDSFVVVYEQDELIVAEVQPGPNGHPYPLTRYRLVQSLGQWQLDDYLWKCSCSNGECDWCGGSGICSVCGGEGECKFCSDELVCQLCKGTRVCNSCKDSDTPGWNSMATMRPRTHAS